MRLTGSHGSVTGALAWLRGQTKLRAVAREGGVCQQDNLQYRHIAPGPPEERMHSTGSHRSVTGALAWPRGQTKLRAVAREGGGGGIVGAGRCVKMESYTNRGQGLCEDRAVYQQETPHSSQRSECARLVVMGP